MTSLRAVRRPAPCAAPRPGSLRTQRRSLRTPRPTARCATRRAELDAEVAAYEAWERRAELLISRAELVTSRAELEFQRAIGTEEVLERSPVAGSAEDQAQRERATHFALDRIKNRRWIDVQCSEMLRRAEVLGVTRLLPASHMCFRIREEGY